MKLVIAFVACLGPSSDCEPVRLPVYDMTPLFCELRGAQQVAAEWVRRHPEYETRGRIACEVSR
jgi:hypothetical protein